MALVPLLSEGDAQTKEVAAMALCGLSHDRASCDAMREVGAVKPLVAMTRDHTPVQPLMLPSIAKPVREWARAALRNLAGHSHALAEAVRQAGFRVPRGRRQTDVP